MSAERESLVEDAEVRQIAEALLAYANQYPCPGIEIEPGVNSGCQAVYGAFDDCDSHGAVAIASRILGLST